MAGRVTAQNLHYNDETSVRPERSRELFRKAFQAGRIQVRGDFERAALTRGAGFVSLGHYPLHLMPAPMSGADNTEYFIHGLVIKVPATEEHILPNELGYLGPLVQEIANHEFAIDPSAINKICFMTLRSLILRPGEQQITQGLWHTNKAPTASTTLQQILPLDMSPASLRWASEADPKGIISEYLVSDIAPTLIQTAPAAKPMKVTENQTSYIVKNPGFAWRQADAYEIVHGNAYSFHAASKPEADDIGQRRTFVRLAYAPAV